MTYESPEWDPSDPDWATQEASTMDSRGRVHDLDNVIAGGRRFINLVSTSAQSADFMSDEYYHVALQAFVNVSRAKVGNSHRASGLLSMTDLFSYLLPYPASVLRWTLIPNLNFLGL
jgi:hypothetical protein